MATAAEMIQQNIQQVRSRFMDVTANVRSTVRGIVPGGGIKLLGNPGPLNRFPAIKTRFESLRGRVTALRSGGFGGLPEAGPGVRVETGGGHPTPGRVKAI